MDHAREQPTHEPGQPPGRVLLSAPAPGQFGVVGCPDGLALGLTGVVRGELPTPAQAALVGRAGGNRALGRLIARRMLMRDTPQGQSAAAAALAAAQAADWARVATILTKLDMAGLLDAVDGLRRAGGGLVQKLADNLASAPIIRLAQIKAAALAVSDLGGFRLTRVEAELSQADRDALGAYITNRLLAEDVEAPTRLTRWDGKLFEVAGDDVTNLGWIGQFLEFFGFGSPPIRDLTERSVRFNRIWMDVDQVKDIIRSQANCASRLELDDKTITDAVKQAYDASRAQAFSRHFSFTVTIVPATVHTNLSQPGSSVDKPAIQPQVSMIWQFHHDDEPGWELSAIAQLTMFKDPGPTGTFRVQNLMAGGQAAWVIPFAKAQLQSQTFVQAIGGAAIRGHAITGVATPTTTWDPSAQGVLGQQISVFLDPNHHVFLGLQLTVSSTFTAPPKGSTGHAIRDQPGVTLDWSGGLVFGGQF